MSIQRALILILALALIAGAIPKAISLMWSASDYAIAELRIEEAIENRRKVLDFKDLKYLTKIPDNIQKMDKLWHLNATSAKRLSNIDALGGLPKLKNLQLGDTRVADLKPLSNLRSLEVLDIRHSWVSDLGPLTQLPRLRWLQMNALGVNSLCPLNEIRFLNWLNLHKSYAKDGSKECFLKLENKVADLGGGASYKQGYVPGKPYLWKVTLERFFKKLEWQ